MSALVEKKICLPLLNPKTGAASRTFDFWSTVDLAENGRITDYKTTKDPDQFIFEKRISYQTDLYAMAVKESLGIEIHEVEYRIVQTPSIKFCNKDKDLDAYEDRCVEWLKDDPSKMQSHVIPINHKRIETAMEWMWSASQKILDNRRSRRWMTNEHACYRWNKKCEYGDVCAAKADGVNWEYLISQGFKYADQRYGGEQYDKEPLSYSNASALTMCEAKYYFRYELGVIPANWDDEAMSTGSAFHAGIAAMKQVGMASAMNAVDEYFKDKAVIGSAVDRVRKVKAMVRAASEKWEAVSDGV